MAVVWLILITLGGLALGIYELKYGLREQSWFWALWGAWGIFGAILIGIVLLGGAVIVFLVSMPTMDPTISVGIVLTVWIVVAFFAFRYRQNFFGKGLFVLSTLWAGVLSILLVRLYDWRIGEALLTTMGLSALVLIVWGLILRQAKATKARKEALYQSVVEDIDSHQQPLW